MKKNIIAIIAIIIVVTIFSHSCGEKSRYNSSIRLLISNEWEINTFVNYRENTILDIGKITYKFDTNGSLKKTINNNVSFSKWELSNDSDYLTIDANTFKITNLSRKNLSLRYGDSEIFFIKKK